MQVFYVTENQYIQSCLGSCLMCWVHPGPSICNPQESDMHMTMQRFSFRVLSTFKKSMNFPKTPKIRHVECCCDGSCCGGPRASKNTQDKRMEACFPKPPK